MRKINTSKIIKILFFMYYYSVCIKIIIHSDYELEYAVISFMLMILPLVIYASLNLAINGKNFLSIISILIYIIIFCLILYGENKGLKNRKIYNQMSNEKNIIHITDEIGWYNKKTRKNNLVFYHIFLKIFYIF